MQVQPKFGGIVRIENPEIVLHAFEALKERGQSPIIVSIGLDDEFGPDLRHLSGIYLATDDCGQDAEAIHQSKIGIDEEFRNPGKSGALEKIREHVRSVLRLIQQKTGRDLMAVEKGPYTHLNINTMDGRYCPLAGIMNSNA